MSHNVEIHQLNLGRAAAELAAMAARLAALASAADKLEADKAAQQFAAEEFQSLLEVRWNTSDFWGKRIFAHLHVWCVN